jgi:hypothetical protein
MKNKDRRNKTMKRKTIIAGASAALFLLCSMLVVSGTWAADPVGEPGREAGKKNPLKNLYFGEQHLHSEWSADAFAAGTRQKPKDAYLWAMGKTITLSTTGEKIKKSTPYDFVALTDHAEYLGVFPSFSDPKNPVSKTKAAQMFIHPDPKNPLAGANAVIKSFKSGVAIKDFVDPKTIVNMWKQHVAITNKYNKPGKFTTLIAFEYTSIPNSQNLHRNVFFRGDTGPAAPFSAFDSVDPEDLWTYLEIQRTQGLECFAIPHNGNVSNGLMYAPTNYRGDPIDARYARPAAVERAADRDDPDQGLLRGPSPSFAE